jgi:hypothetical protein
MAKFITSNELNTALEKLFEEAEKYLLLISPYVRLHPRYKSVLKTKKNLDKLELVVVFGKNEADPARSINEDDLIFFKEFPNVEIRYEKRLHAKYFSSEKAALITSMNLYDYSHNNNIESGVLTEPSMLSGFGTLDEQAAGYFERVVEQAELLFQRIPHRRDTSLGLGLKSKFTHSTIEVDRLDEFFKPSKVIVGQASTESGFCIITGERILFNIAKPMSDIEYRKWSITADKKIKGNYCHFSGELGSTSFEKPILVKNWRKAKDKFGF